MAALKNDGFNKSYNVEWVQRQQPIIVANLMLQHFHILNLKSKRTQNSLLLKISVLWYVVLLLTDQLLTKQSKYFISAYFVAKPENSCPLWVELQLLRLFFYWLRDHRWSISRQLMSQTAIFNRRVCSTPPIKAALCQFSFISWAAACCANGSDRCGTGPPWAIFNPKSCLR